MDICTKIILEVAVDFVINEMLFNMYDGHFFVWAIMIHFPCLQHPCSFSSKDH